MSSLTGRALTLVAVGTDKEVSMFFAVRAGAPRMVVFIGSSIATLGRSVGLGGSAGTPPRAPGALGLTSLVSGGFSTVGVRRGADWSCGLAAGGVSDRAGAGAAVALLGAPLSAGGSTAGPR
jgi:hypothetical protein